VIATGNHFLLDVVAGAMVTAAAVSIEVAAGRWLPAYRRRRYTGFGDLRTRRSAAKPSQAGKTSGARAHL
jgi:hypothetical protein